MVEVNISLAFLHWVRITLHPSPFVSDIAVFVLKRDVKLQLTNQSNPSLMVFPRRELSGLLSVNSLRAMFISVQ